MRVYVTITHTKDGAHCLGVFTNKRLAEEMAREWLIAILTSLGATDDQARWAANCEDYSDIGHLDDNYTEVIERILNTDSL